MKLISFNTIGKLNCTEDKLREALSRIFLAKFFNDIENIVLDNYMEMIEKNEEEFSLRFVLDIQKDDMDKLLSLEIN